MGYTSKRAKRLFQTKDFNRLCPVCRQYYFIEPHDICPICKWEDDSVQLSDPDFAGGANELSLNEAIRKYNKSKNL